MRSSVDLWLDRTSTPIGDLLVVSDAEVRLRAVFFADGEARMHKTLRTQYGTNGFRLEPQQGDRTLTQAIDAYFAGELDAIDSLPVAMVGTEFQRSVWRELRRIPCGTTVSYSEIARRIDAAAAVRAVGLANGSNPVGVVVPCHRVIGANGSLTGYGGGIERKRWLLSHESARSTGQLTLLSLSHEREEGR